MENYDVIIIGGGINGLTCAAYLGKAGLKTAVIEARGECGAHCDTIEAGIPGYMFNTHAVWMVTPMSPAMKDLELAKYGLEWRTTDYAWGKNFKNGKNSLSGTNPFDTIENWKKHSAKDADLLERSLEYFYPNIIDFTELMQKWIYSAPSMDTMNLMSGFIDKYFKALGVNCSGKQFLNMDGFEIMDILFESEYTKTLALALGWIAGFNPAHKTIGAMGATILGLFIGPFYPSVVVKGGSHELTHALVQAAIDNGVKIIPNCPVSEIIVEGGEAKGVVLSDRAIYPGLKIMAKKVISNVSLKPTFLDMIGEDKIGHEIAKLVKAYSYDEQNLFTVHYALSGAPQFKSAQFDEGIQRCYMGYFGGDTTAEMKSFANDISRHTKIIHDKIICNYFITTLADPLQAPPGGHTTHVWFDVPPEPVSWKHGKLNGFMDWDVIKEKLADDITDTYESYAPGFKKLIKDRLVYTPLDQFRSNPSAVLGNWAGGSMIPEQFYEKRPIPQIMRGGSRTFLKNLYLSNSIHVASNSTLASGYIAACEVAEDMGARNQSWWSSQACLWFLENMSDIPLNLGVK